jgi:DNA-binding CsgD family transcriptional regulator
MLSVSDTFGAVLDQLNAGVVIIYPNGKVLHANRAASDMFTIGWPIRMANGYIQAEERKTTELLLKALHYVAGEAHTSPPERVLLEIVLSPSSSLNGAAVGSLKPVSRGDCEVDSLIALFVKQRSDRLQTYLAGVAECFDLTPAETRTIEQLMHGGNVAEIAMALKVSENTVKSHLQNIFTKTGTSRQVDLLRVVHDLLAPLRAPLKRKTASGLLHRRRYSRNALPAGRFRSKERPAARARSG